LLLSKLTSFNDPPKADNPCLLAGRDPEALLKNVARDFSDI